MSPDALPVVLLLFANDRHGDTAGYLRDLVAERHRITEALSGADGRRLRLVVESNTTAEVLFDLLDSHSDHVIGLHYGGHATGDALHLEDDEGRPEAVLRDGLAAYIARLPALRWVFLNGCATEAHVGALHRASRVPVIATERAIVDEVATAFADRFYSALGRGMSLRECFERASAAGQARTTVEGTRRMARPAGQGKGGAVSGPELGWPWSLHVHPDAPAAADWRLGAERTGWRRRIGVAALVAGVLAAGGAGWWLLAREPTDPAPIVGATAPTLRLGEVALRKDELTLPVEGLDGDDAIDARLRVRCEGEEWIELELTESAAPNAARRRFTPSLEGREAIFPGPGCACVLEVKASDGRVAQRQDVCAHASGEAYFAFYHRGESDDVQFRKLLRGVSDTVDEVENHTRGRSVLLIERRESDAVQLKPALAKRIAAAGGLVQVIWRGTDRGAPASRVLDPFDEGDEGTAGSLTVRHLSGANAEAYAITHHFHVLLLHAALAAEGRGGERVDIEASHLSAAQNAAHEVVRALRSEGSAALRAAEPEAVEQLIVQSEAMAAAAARRLAELQSAPGVEPDGREP